jgi:cyclophilin family peptidyl-prolyl cis-trans isomerase
VQSARSEAKPSEVREGLPRFAQFRALPKIVAGGFRVTSSRRSVLMLALALPLLCLAPSDASAQSAGAKPVVVLTTTLGEIEIELDEAKAPITVKNFLAYVDEGFYDGTIFHRVIRDFMIQGGGFTPQMSQKKTKANIQNEAANGLKNVKGSLAMARTSAPHSASSQFFINHKDNSFLDYPGQDGWGYAVFGRVVKGIEVVDKIAAVQTGVKAGMSDVPVQSVAIVSARRKK